MIIDTHCHLDFPEFDADRTETLERARAAGVVRFINIGSSINGTFRSIELALAHEDVFAAVGIHPHEAPSVNDEVIAKFRSYAQSKKVVAIGEVGLDFYKNLRPRDVQINAYKRFIWLARDLNLPLVLHSRDAGTEVLDILKQEGGPSPRAVMHCFSGDADLLKACLDAGLYISFTANITFKNAKDLRKVAKAMPVERLFLETDAPYLAPQALRGKRNEPAFLKHLVDEWADITGLSQGDIERITTHNANTFFGLGLAGGAKIAYEIRDSVYLNITNECTNNCDFCVRSQTSFVKGHNLKLEKEPTVREIVKAVGNPKRYKEVVFCGYGEPTARLDTVKSVATALKKKGAAIRLVTNGHSDLINKRKTVPELVGLIDRISVSLNADTPALYTEICKPVFGAKAYEAMMGFIRDARASGIEVELTCLDLPGVDLQRCEAIARELGAAFRLRHLGTVG